MARLSERIANTFNKTPNKRKFSQSNFAFMVANHEEIQEAIQDGWTIKNIFKQYKKEGVFFATYNTFRRTWYRFLEVQAEESLTPEEKKKPKSTLGNNDMPSQNKTFEDIEVRQEDENSPRVVSVVKERFSYDNRKYMKD